MIDAHVNIWFSNRSDFLFFLFHYMVVKININKKDNYLNSLFLFMFFFVDTRYIFFINTVVCWIKMKAIEIEIRKKI